MTMFDTSERDLIRTLGTMAETAIQRCYHNRTEARELVAQWIKQDRRFDGLDPSKLAERVDQLRSNGAKLDLRDPRLRGLPARPLERDQSW